MNFDAKKHDILVVKTQLMVGARSIYRELHLIKSGDDLNSLLRLVPESYHAAIRNSKECVVQLKWAQLLPTLRAYATVQVAVRMPRHRSWSYISPEGASFITAMKDGSIINTNEPPAPAYIGGVLIPDVANAVLSKEC
jgi:hypothetical protein